MYTGEPMTNEFRSNNSKAAKLTGQQVVEIREKYNSFGYTQARLSREYTVSISTIANIVRGVSWQQLPLMKTPSMEAESLATGQAELEELMRKRLVAGEFEVSASPSEPTVETQLSPEAQSNINRYLGKERK